LRASFIIVAVVVALLCAACSSGRDVESSAAGQPLSLADEMIVGDLAPTLGLGPLTSTCPDPGELAPDTTFVCSATTEEGQVIQVEAVVNAEGRLQLTTANVVSSAALPSFERGVAAMLNDSVGSNFTAESVDCGPTAVVLPPDLTMGCALVMPASGEVFDVTMTVTDLDERHFSLVVADQPRTTTTETSG